MIHAKLVSFTQNGAKTLSRIAGLLKDEYVERYVRTVDPSLFETSLSRFSQQAMVDCDLIIFVGAAGIAVRSVAPYLQGKAFDPAVLVVDEKSNFVIPLLSGHLGGANRLAERIADGLGAQAVITTATDLNGVFAVDAWAKMHGCIVWDVPNIKHISGALLRGEAVGLKSRFPVDGSLPAHVSLNLDSESGIFVGYNINAKPYTHTLHLIPRIVHLGIGCRRGISAEAVEGTVMMVLKQSGVPLAAVCTVASIDVKKDEPGLLLFCQRHDLPFVTFSADKLQNVSGGFTASGFVRQTVGVDNVCERSAACSSGGGKLLCRKTAVNGVTVALAEQDWQVTFQQV